MFRSSQIKHGNGVKCYEIAQRESVSVMNVRVNHILRRWVTMTHLHDGTCERVHELLCNLKHDSK